MMLRLIALLIVTASTAFAGPAEHVIIIGLDGCRPEAIQRTDCPAIKSLIKNGAVCWRAQAVKPTVTQVNWAAILTGCLPEKNGITQHPVKEGELGVVRDATPTLFQVAGAAGLTGKAYLGHWKLYPLDKPSGSIIIERSSGSAGVIGRAAAAYIREAKPAVCFVYIGDLDGQGHKHGWQSPEQLAAMKPVDDAVAQIVGAVREAKIEGSTLIMLASDHGGHGKSHAEGTAEDQTIPWIVSGPMVTPGRVIEREVSTVDTAATAAWALGMKTPAVWDGRAVVEVFKP
jgi:predicted AlkP superfamily pyrophosphatase or phosphodiesterase